MAKQAISITLSPPSLQYLRAKTLKEKRKSLSETLDLLILESMGGVGMKRSVVGTVEADDAMDSGDLDSAVRSWFEKGVGGKSPRRKRRSA